MAPRHRAAGQAARARAPSEGGQRGRRPPRAARGGLAGRQGLAQRREGRRPGRAPPARGGGRARLRGGPAPPRGHRGAAQARPVRLPRARPLGRAPLRPLPVVSGVGRRQRQRHLLHRRGGRHPAVGAGELPGRRAHGAGRLAAVRGLPQARPRRGARAALHDRGQARARRGRLQARRAPARLRPRRRAAQHRRAAAAGDRVLAVGRLPRRRPRGARLDPRGAQPPGAAPHRRADLRGHGRAHPGARRDRQGVRRRARRRRRRGSASAACACARSTARARARRSSTPGRWARASRGCSTWRSSRTCPATSAPR